MIAILSRTQVEPLVLQRQQCSAIRICWDVLLHFVAIRICNLKAMIDTSHISPCLILWREASPLRCFMLERS